MRVFPLVLLLLIVLVQAEIWLGRWGLPYVMSLTSDLEAQQQRNGSARLRNEQLAAEVADLRDGLEMIEETARRDMGMIRPDELLVVYTRAPATR